MGQRISLKEFFNHAKFASGVIDIRGAKYPGIRRGMIIPASVNAVVARTIHGLKTKITWELPYPSTLCMILDIDSTSLKDSVSPI